MIPRCNKEAYRQLWAPGIQKTHLIQNDKLGRRGKRERFVVQAAGEPMSMAPLLLQNRTTKQDFPTAVFPRSTNLYNVEFLESVAMATRNPLVH